jgi:anaerobic magnesium-protoporphyrin IX monomethyl ester cyclase
VLYTIDSSARKPSNDVLERLSKSRRVLLIEANDQRRWVGGRVTPEVHIPPVGLMYVASSTRRDHPDVHIQILETSLDGRTDDQLVAKLLEYRPDAVGIRSISLFEDELKRVAELTRSVLDIPIVAGGPIATARRGAVLQAISAIDLLVVGEGELTFSRLLAGTASNGLVFRHGNETVDLGDGDVVDNLDELPFPDYGLVDLSRYEEHLSYAYNHRRQGVLLTSRGCPFLCTYCNTFALRGERGR